MKSSIQEKVHKAIEPTGSPQTILTAIKYMSHIVTSKVMMWLSTVAAGHTPYTISVSPNLLHETPAF